MATVIVLYGPKAVGKSWSPRRLSTAWACGTLTSMRWCSTCWRPGSDPTPPTAGWRGEEAGWIYDQATIQAAGRRLDVRIDTGKPQDPASVVAALRPLLG
jgi:hypothetical protein